jgi:hypothetical protein
LESASRQGGQSSRYTRALWVSTNRHGEALARDRVSASPATLIEFLVVFGQSPDFVGVVDNPSEFHAVLLACPPGLSHKLLNYLSRCSIGDKLAVAVKDSSRSVHGKSNWRAPK